MKPKQDQQLRVRVTKKTLKAINEKAEKLELNRSDVIREALAAYLKSGYELRHV